ncbi:CHAP domain-containing protein [Actinomadura sediminis]|uniref:CHAP domain-containing protein n=1 Tax=Actinomadura sediminis TaxID=1038904 RepID=A0ABW3ENS6_9ACTN
MTPENEKTDAAEAAHMDKVDVHWGVHNPTEPDEEQVLARLYGEPEADGIYRLAAATAPMAAAAAPSGAQAILAEARKSLGMSGRPNAITREYASRHGDAFLSAPWCDMAVTYWARHSGTAEAVLPAGDRAYTPWHAADFQKIGSWHSGTTARVNAAKPGDIVFFDWGESNTIGAIDHVGVVERVLGGGRVQTIEGNTGDACKRRVRGSGVIAGYGRPAYEEVDDMPDYVSVGVSTPQELPPNTWVTVEWGEEYADAEHHHWDRGGSSLLVGACRYALTANVRIEGLPKGTEIQARTVEVEEAGGRRDGGPIAEYTASDGDTFLLYSLPADTVGDGFRVRFQVIQYGTAAGRITAGSAKAFAWPT